MIDVDKAAHELALMCASEIPIKAQGSVILTKQITKKLASTYYETYNQITAELNMLISKGIEPDDASN